MSCLFRRPFLELQPLRRQSHQCWFQHPLLRALRRSPQIPIRLEHVGVVVVQKFRNFCDGLFRSNSRPIPPLQNRGLAPRNRLDRRVGHAAERRRKWNLPQHAHCARQNLSLIEAGKPQTQIKRITHIYILNATRKKLTPARALVDFDELKAPCYYGFRRQITFSPPESPSSSLA